MAGGAYSRRFILVQSGAQGYTVPPDKLAVIKCTSAYSAGPGAGVFSLSIAGKPVLLRTVSYDDGDLAANLHIVAYPGEVITVNSPSPTTTCVSGYLLNWP